MSNVPPYEPPPPPAPPTPPSAPFGGNELVYPTNPPKDPVMILLLNLFVFGGLGSILMGQKTKGIVAIAVAIVAGIPTCGTATLLVGAFGAIDGYLQAQQLKLGHPVGQWTFFNDHR